MNLVIPTVDPATAAASGAFLLDVREADEFRAGRAPGSAHVPLGELPGRMPELPGDRQIVCVCRSGNRSGVATVELRSHGFDAVNLAGGMQAWAREGLPVVAHDGGPGVVL